MTAAPYRPGSHAHALYYDPDYGTCSAPVTVESCTPDPRSAPGVLWLVTYRDPRGVEHVSHVGVHGCGDYVMSPAEVEKCRRSRTDLPDSEPCAGCRPAGAVNPDGPVYSLAEQVLAAAGAE